MTSRFRHETGSTAARWWRRVLILFILTASASLAQPGWAEEGEEEKQRILPFFKEWFDEQDIDLPLPYGVGLVGIYMERSIEVDDVRVSFGDRPPTSVSETAEFGVKNDTSVISARADAWILPFLNVYLMGGKTRSDSLMNVEVEIPVPGPGDPIRRTIEVDSDVEGPFWGGGATAVFGYGNWFGMLDANYGVADLDLFEGELDIWLFSGRAGRMVQQDTRQWMFWAGAMYMDSKRTVLLTEDLPVIGPTLIEVDQRPTNPWTFQLGGSVTFDKRWTLLTEAGFNSDSDFVLIFNTTFRF